MKNIFNEVFKFVIVVCFSIGGFYAFKGFYKQNNISKSSEPTLSLQAQKLKTYLLEKNKPLKIEISHLSQRFEKEVAEIKKLKVSQDKKSLFYISIQLFTDDSDLKAPLIAQIRFIDVKTGNTIKEESINLE